MGDTEDALSTSFSTDIRPFIDVIDTLRRFGIQQDIPLPNVVVVGDQSSGKSSIIEALSGVSLPRGKGIVTRCPLELQLKRVLNVPWVAKLSYKTKDGEQVELVIYSAYDVEEYIRQAQNSICGKGRGISSELITLRIESPAQNAPDLTLIDLPGIARIALADQSKDICETIKKMIMKYVKPANTVILCVICAHLDIAVNESIKIAQEVDPDGLRTIGVITKPDLADLSQKQEVLNILNNERIDLVKGFSMVKCRSQQELEDNVLLEESTNNEKDFFQNDEIYSSANINQFGTLNLATKISEELVDVIKASLPQLKCNIDNALSDTQSQLNELPQGVPETFHEKRTYLAKFICNLNTVMKKLLNDGKHSSNEENMYLTWRCLCSKFCDSIRTKVEDRIWGEYTLSYLTTRIAKSRGREISFFFNFELFESLVTRLIATLMVDAIIFAKSINSHVESSIEQLLNKSFKHLPIIERELKGILKLKSMKSLERTERKLKFVFEQEKYAFTMDHNFEKELKKLHKKEMQSGGMAVSENDKFMAEFNKGGAKSMLDLIKTYVKIVVTRLCDIVPMTIHQCSIVHLGNELDNGFMEFGTSLGVEEKITENKRIHDERRALLEKIERLHKAKLELAKF